MSMKPRLKVAVFLILFCLPLTINAQLRVFACEPEWSALAEEIGGTLVKASSATHALQDPHYVEARPSLISRVRNADLVVCSGAQLEIGWLPLLLSKANNPAVLPGKDGFLEASSVVPRLGVPDSVDRAQGDMHPQGNPHIQMNPHNITRVARIMGERMALIDPEHSQDYARTTAEFLERWTAAIAGWEEKAQALAGSRVVCHHTSWIYLEDWLQLIEVATLEPVPGIPPTASHLSSLLNELGADGKGAEVIIRAPFQSSKASEWLESRTGIPAVMLPLTVGGSEGANNLFDLFEDVIDRLLSTQAGVGS
jgi:zinc/manganese transport system substrate-binding protein